MYLGFSDQNATFLGKIDKFVYLNGFLLKEKNSMFKLKIIFILSVRLTRVTTSCVSSNVNNFYFNV